MESFLCQPIIFPNFHVRLIFLSEQNAELYNHLVQGNAGWAGPDRAEVSFSALHSDNGQ